MRGGDERPVARGHVDRLPAQGRPATGNYTPRVPEGVSGRGMGQLQREQRGSERAGGCELVLRTGPLCSTCPLGDCGGFILPWSPSELLEGISYFADPGAGK